MSDKQKPTPGPWYANGNGVHIRKGTVGLCVACAYDPNEPNQSNDVCHANAKLIAAAPDLLAALETAGDALCQVTWELRRKTPKAVNGAIDVVRAAIAKAKGEPLPPAPEQAR